VIGIFLKHGFAWVDADNKVPIKEGSSGFKYIEAVTLELELQE